MLSRARRYVFSFMVWVPLQACGANFPDTYSAEATYGWVVDEKTGEPIPGVNVAAFWVLRGGWHFDDTRPLHVAETVTEEDGSFRIPGWGPKKRPEEEILTDKDPVLYLFKLGYYPKGMLNPYGDPNKLGEKRVRTWLRNGRSLKLKQFDGDTRRYKRLLNSDARNIEGVKTVDDECAWERVRRMIVALKREQLRLTGSETSDEFVLRQLRAEYRHEPCDAQTVFKER